MKRTVPSSLHEGTVGELMDWVRRLVLGAYPDHGIEYWSAARRSLVDQSVEHGFHADERLPQRVQYPGAFVRRGGEGFVIEVLVRERSNPALQRLMFAKTFGTREMAQDIAALVTEALESVFFYEEQSVIPELFAKLPKLNPYVTNLDGRVELINAETEAGHEAIVTCQGKLIAVTTEPSKLAAQATIEDWLTVLAGQQRLGARIRIVQGEALAV